MSDPTRTTRRPGRLWVTNVRRIQQLTPRMRRITVTSPELARFESNGTDQHIAIYFYGEDVTLPRPFTTEAARGIYPHTRPTMRRYTIRQARPEMCEVDLDFVLHPGDHLAAGWAADACEGSELIWFGPTPAYSVDPDAEEYLLVGDETAIPAIAGILETMPERMPVRIHIEVADPAEEQPLPLTANTRLIWAHRHDRRAGDALWSSVMSGPRPAGQARIWGAAERDVISRLRRHAVSIWELPRSEVHLTAYWTVDREQDSD